MDGHARGLDCNSRKKTGRWPSAPQSREPGIDPEYHRGRDDGRDHDRVATLEAMRLGKLPGVSEAG
jgi:hypothetical protein